MWKFQTIETFLKFLISCGSSGGFLAVCVGLAGQQSKAIGLGWQQRGNWNFYHQVCDRAEDHSGCGGQQH